MQPTSRRPRALVVSGTPSSPPPALALRRCPRGLEQRLQGAGSEALAVDDHGLAGAQLAADALGRRSMWALGRRVVAELGRQRGGEGGGSPGA